MDERQLPSLTPKQLDALRRFALLEIGEEELHERLAGVFEIHFEPMRTAAAGRHQRRTVIPDKSARGPAAVPAGAVAPSAGSTISRVSASISSSQLRMGIAATR